MPAPGTIDAGFFCEDEQVDLISAIEKEQLKENVPDVRPGDTVRVVVKVVEGDNVRAQAFEGVVIGMNGAGLTHTFKVRRIASHGIGVERTFLLHSPRIESVEILRRGDVRRAKLYYLRERVGKHARIKEKREEAQKA